MRRALTRIAHGMILLSPLLGSSMAAGTPSGTITVVDTFNPSSVSAAGTSTYRVQISNSDTAALTGVSFPIDLSKMTSQIISGSSSCGGSAIITGTTATWTGGTIAGAPSTTKPTICDFTFQVTATLTSGNYTTTFPAEAMTTDQGLTNPNGSAATLTVTPAQKLTHSFQTADLSYGTTVVNSGPYILPFNTGNPTQFIINVTNPNPFTVQGVTQTMDLTSRYSYGVQSVSINTALSTCGSSTSQLLTNSSSTMTSVGFSNVNIPGNTTCKLVLDVGPQIIRDSYNNASETAIAPYLKSAGLYPIIEATTNTTDPTINAAPIQYYLNITPAYRIGKSFNGQNNLNLNYDPSVIPRLEIGVANTSSTTGLVSLVDRLPEGMTLDGTVQIMSVSSAGCTTTGITAASGATQVSFSDVSIPAAPSLSQKSLCAYSFGLATYTSGYNSINDHTFSNQTTSNLVEQSSGSAAAAQLSTVSGELISKTGGSAQVGGWNQYTITITNRTMNPLTSISFSDSWTHQLLISEVMSSSQCDGVITINADRKGFSLSGGSIPGGVNGSYPSCTITIPIDPASSAVGSFPNTTGAVTTNRGTLAPVTGTVAYGRRVVDLSTEMATLQVGLPGYVTTEVSNITASTQQDNVFIPNIQSGTGPAVFDPSRPIMYACGMVGHNPTWPPATLRTDMNQTLSPTLYTMTSTGVTLNAPIPGVNYQNYLSNNMSVCRFMIPMIGQAASPATTVNATVTDSAGTDITGKYKTALYYAVNAQNTYNINKEFNPQTVVAGQITRLSIALANQTSSTSDDISATYAQVTDVLPLGMQVDLSSFKRNQPDGSYISTDKVPSLGNVYYNSTGGMPCLEIDATRTTIISRCRTTVNSNNYNSIPILITRYGDLINTIPVENVRPFYGSVVGPASASAKATRGIAIAKSFNPTQIKPDTTSTMAFQLYNATVIGEPANILSFNDTLPSGMTVIPNQSGAVNLSGNCNGASASYNSTTRLLSFSGITLNPQTDCTVSVQVGATIRPTANTSLTNTIPASGVTSTSGASNPQAATDTLTVLPNAQCSVGTSTYTTSNPGMLPLGTSTPLTFSIKNTGESNITTANLGVSTSGAPGYTISLGGAPGSTNPQTAWNNWINANPTGIPVGGTLTGTITFNTPSTATPGTQQSVSISFNPTDGTSCGPQTVSVVGQVMAKPQVQIIKEQALCTDANCTNLTWSTEKLAVNPCQYVAYRVTASNLSGGPAYRPYLTDAWPVNLNFKSVSATTTPAGRQMLWSVDDGTLSTTAPITLNNGQTLKAWMDTNGDGDSTTADSLSAGENFQIILTGQVNGGTACRP